MNSIETVFNDDEDNSVAATSSDGLKIDSEEYQSTLSGSDFSLETTSLQPEFSEYDSTIGGLDPEEEAFSTVEEPSFTAGRNCQNQTINKSYH